MLIISFRFTLNYFISLLEYSYFLSSGISSSLRISDVKVPTYAFTGDTVKLQCNYEEAENDKLYSLNWWKDNDQFYTFVPGQKVSLYDVKGIIVDVSINKYFYKLLYKSSSMGGINLAYCTLI